MLNRGTFYEEKIVSMHSVRSHQAERTSQSPIRCAVACLILGLLCFQLSRVYLVVPADAFICAAPEHDHGGATLKHDDHDHSDEAMEALFADQHDDRNYITHCKDTIDGLGLTPAHPYSMPSASAPQTLVETAVILPSEATLPAGNVVPPPFQPPRTLS